MKDLYISTNKPDNFDPFGEVAASYIAYKDTFLLLKRHPSCSYGNQWCLPGGKVEADETPIEGAIREVQEEVGLFFSKDCIKSLGKLYVRRPDIDYVFHMFFTSIGILPSLIIDTKEHLEGKWVTYEQAIELPLILGGEETLSHYIDRIYLSEKPC